MGFSYSQWGLCCDFCGQSKPEFNVKKIPCPYEWCQAWACCKNCHTKKLHLRSSCGILDKNNKQITLTHKEFCKVRSINYDKGIKPNIRILTTEGEIVKL